MSLIARCVNCLLRILKFNKMFLDIESTDGDIKEFEKIILKTREKDDCKLPPVKLFRNYIKSRINIGEHTTHLLKRKKSSGNKIIIYFHGGAYVKGPLSFQWQFLDEIANATMYDIAVIDYPKIPEFTYKEAIQNCQSVFEKILIEYKESDIIFIGDSAGGGLALSVFMSLREHGKKFPEKMILISPWLDISMTHKEIPEYKDSDLVLTVDGLIQCGLYYASDIDNKDWRVSPTYGELDKLPETHVFVGGSELFYPDCRDFIKKAKEKSCLAELHFSENMQHVWPIIPLMPESKKAINEIIELLKF